AHWTMRIPPLLIALLGITLGTLPWLINTLIRGTALSVFPRSSFEEYSSTYDHAHSWSAIITALALGAFVYIFWDHIHRAVNGFFHKFDRYAMSAWYERLLAGIPRVAGALTRRIQSGKLTSATMMLLGFTTLLVGA